MSEIIFISNARLSFPHIAEPQSKDQPDGSKRISYNCELLTLPDHPGYKQFMQLYATMAAEKWKEHANTVMQMIHQDRKSRCYGSGNEKLSKKTYKPYDGYDGHMYITAGRDTPPQIIQADGKPIDPANTMAYQQLTRKMYGGCRVNAAIKPWLQDNSHGRGVRCDLIALQFAGDDVAFGDGGTVDVTGIFGAVAAPAGPSAAPAMPVPPFMQGMPSFLS